MKIVFTISLVAVLNIMIAQPNIGVQVFKTGFSFPIDIENAGDGSDRLFIVERDGLVKIIDKDGSVMPKPFLDIEDQVSTYFEGGFLGLAFHPNYKENGYFYVNYTGPTQANFNTFVSRFQVSPNNPDSALLSSEKVLITFSQPAGNHNAGDLAFGPDGYLYIPFGDGGPRDCAPQSGNTFLGKVLRIDVNQNVDQIPYYGIPADNPYIDSSSILNEIWAMGLRNPFRFSFDRASGNMWLADVGQSTYEEVNFLPSGTGGGTNFGWPFKEANSCFSSPNCNLTTCNDPDFTDPIYQYGRSEGTSITGGFVYRGCEFPDLNGLYVMADYNSGNFWGINANFEIDTFSFVVSNIASFGEDEFGELYVARLGNGTIYQIVSTNSANCQGCPLNRMVMDVLSDSTVQSGNTIFASGAISPAASLTLQSNSFSLQPGFEVLLNAVFSTEINPCDKGN